MKVRFATQWNTEHAIFVSEVDDVDTAIPDLTFSIQQLRDKFVLETEVLKSQLARKGQYLFNGKELTENGSEEAFDSPSVEIPQNYDFVDADADTMSLRGAVAALQQARNSSSQARIEGRGDGEGAVETSSADSGAQQSPTLGT